MAEVIGTEIQEDLEAQVAEVHLVKVVQVAAAQLLNLLNREIVVHTDLETLAAAEVLLGTMEIQEVQILEVAAAEVLVVQDNQEIIQVPAVQENHIQYQVQR